MAEAEIKPPFRNALAAGCGAAIIEFSNFKPENPLKDTAFELGRKPSEPFIKWTAPVFKAAFLNFKGYGLRVAYMLLFFKYSLSMTNQSHAIPREAEVVEPHQPLRTASLSVCLPS